MKHVREYGLIAAVGLLLVLNVTGVVRSIAGVDTALLVTLLAGYKTFYSSVSALLAREISADLALCVAVIAALSVGEYAAAAEAMFIVMVGEELESFAAGRTEAAIRRFVAQMPRVARLVREGREEQVDAASLAPDDLIAVRAGERIPADGVVESGFSSVDESSITGEPLPSDKQPEDEVFSGTLNGNGLLHVRVSRAGSETTLARVVALVEEAKKQSAPVERLADRYARYFLPALLLAATLTFFFTKDWLRTVAVLIVACPCALILATPTAMVAAIGGLARRGILVRGGDVVQKAAGIDTVLFDKTGTVTEGRFEIVQVIAAGVSEDEVLALAAAAERGSSHIIARVIVEEAARRGLAAAGGGDARVIPGRGAECNLLGRTIRAGSAAFLVGCGVKGVESITKEAVRPGVTAVLVSDGDSLAGAILLRDRVREGAREAVEKLRGMGIGRVMMVTGDQRRAAEVIAWEAGIGEVEAGLLPEEKLDRVRQLAGEGRAVAMIGDGINDAPALATAAVGIAVAGATDITAEAADIVYLPHSLRKLPRVFDVSRRAMRTAWLNIVLFAGVVNAFAVLACATGKIGPIGAALTHQLSSFCVMMNSLRLLRVEKEGSGLAGTIGAKLQPVWERAREIRPTVQWLRPGFIALSLLIAFAGFYMVGPDEVGVVERFGRKVTPFSSPGLHYKLPWPVERLTRIRPRAVRVVEIGFRSSGAKGTAEPPAYEWNVQHRSGRYQKRPDEALMLSGDQNMIELNAAVHYDIARPDALLFRQADGDETMRQAAESIVQAIIMTSALDDVLTTGRRAIESRAEAQLQRRLDLYDTGIRVLRVKLEDVHPSVEVVDAFRDVSAASEEKSRLINEAEAYRNEQVALARGNGRAQIETARGYTTGRTNRADGDSARFTQQEQAFRLAPRVTETRLYLETMDQVLPCRRKLIVDSGKGKRHLWLLEDGVEVAPPQPLR